LKTIKYDGVTYTCPYRDLLRPLTTEERSALVEDIRNRGIIIPVLVDEHHAILDGRHRLEIAAELGLRDCPITVTRGLTQEQKQDFAIDAQATPEPRGDEAGRRAKTEG
jgi:ParB-like chromosome segregation protein Spo0J